MRAMGFSLGVTGGSRAGPFVASPPPPPSPAPSFDPRQLFANGEVGALYDAGDMASLFGDAAGTVAGAVDAPVGRMMDRSGRDNALAQPAAAARPMLRRDANGRAYLAFDGIDDWLGSTAAELRITGPVTLAIAMRRNVGDAHDMWISAQTDAARVNPYEFRTNPSGIPEFIASAEGAFETATAGTAVPVGVDEVVTATRTGSTVAFTVGEAASSTPHTMVPTFDTATEFRLASRRGMPLFTNGRVYGALVVGRVLTPAEGAGLRTYLAMRAGFAG